MVKELADYMVANLTGLTKGTTLQVGFRPSTAPDDCTTIQTRSGGIPDDDNRLQVQKPLQVVTRNVAYNAGEDECTRIFNFLRDLRQVSMSGFHVYTVSGIEPAYMGPDSKGRHEFSANLILRIRKDN